MTLLIEIYQSGAVWEWSLSDMHNQTMEGVYAYGTSPDYHQACDMALIAWEQHAKEEA